MKENIEILEEFIKYFEAEAISIKYRRNISITVGEDDIQAIENLIKGYRNLEKENEKLIYELQEKDDEVRFANRDIKVFETEFIQKTKIKEIRDKAEVMDYYTLPDVIDDLNKLLGEELMEDK